MSEVTVNQIRPGFYLDSVALMRISAKIAALPDVQEAALMIGSVSNKQIMRDAGLLADNGESAGANDLIMGIRANTEAAAKTAMAAASEALDSSVSVTAEASDWKPKSLTGALDALPNANLALISVPGTFAAREAQKALRRNLNVMIFSDNVTLEAECALKQEAQERGLLVMGPDCGTAVINGIPLAFANAVAAGNIGVIAASGTGLQEFSVLVSRAGYGISHGIGVGGRDLSDHVGAISTLTAIDLLEHDEATKHIVLISKPPGQNTAKQVMQRLQACNKPITVCFIGYQGGTESSANLNFATTLRQAAELAIGVSIIAENSIETSPLSSQRCYLRGLFSGGTLCAETQVILKQAGLEFVSNVAIPGVKKLTEGDQGFTPEHSLIDLGADEYTVGRPHPMIEPGVRNDVLAKALAQTDTAVVLLDVVLGYGSHIDPAGAIAETITATPQDGPIIIASVCGVEGDPQNYQAQVQKLESAGIVVMPSNAHAAELAAHIITANR